jgi:predicted nuclease with RNAse H fold
MFVQRMREKCPAVPVTESHPKALLKAVAENRWGIFSARFHVNANPPEEHARDAIVAAVAARESFEGRWTHDLGATRLAGEQDPLNYWLAPVHYYWPET